MTKSPTVETTAKERKLERRIDFLNEVVDRLQDAMGLVISVEANNKNKTSTKVVFEITLAPGIWEDSYKYVVLRDAMYAVIKHHIEVLLETGHNGIVEEIVVQKIKKEGF